MDTTVGPRNLPTNLPPSCPHPRPPEEERGQDWQVGHSWGSWPCEIRIPTSRCEHRVVVRHPPSAQTTFLELSVVMVEEIHAGIKDVDLDSANPTESALCVAD